MTSPSEEHASRPSDDAASDRRVGELVADRPCLQCGYNLIGQPIVRERHYDMLMARCPECGTVVALQEYPRLGRWANRWAAALAAFWLLIMLGMLLLNAIIVSAVSDSTSTAAAQPYMEWLGEHQRAWMKENDDPDYDMYYGPGGALGGTQFYWYLDRDWWNAQDADSLLAQAGGWTNVVDWRSLRGLWWMVFWMFVFGVFWAGALMRFGRVRLLLIGMVIVLTAAGFSFLLFQQNWSFAFNQSIMQIATSQIRPYVVPIGFFVALLSMTPGLLFGRMIVRGLIRVLLPPRHISALSILWTCDGKAPPRPARP